MDVVVRGRHTGVAERFRNVAEEKLARLERLDARVMRIDVEVSHEANPRLSDECERVELTCRSKGPVIRAEAAADDAFAALDMAIGKLEERLRRAADRRRVHHGNRTPVSVATALAADVPPQQTPSGARRNRDTNGVEPPAPSSDERAAGLITDSLDVQGDGPLVVREKVHGSPAMTLDQALHEMELVGHDFFLFREAGSERPSVVYRRRGYSYGVIRLST